MLKEIELARANGEWVKYDDVIVGITEACQIWWDQLRRVGNRVAADVMNCDKKEQVISLIQSEINRVMNQIKADSLEAAELSKPPPVDETKTT